MFRVCWLLFLGGCVNLPSPQPSDTTFSDDKRDWLEVYRGEIKIAVENDDSDAYHFFMREFLVERVRIWKEAKKNIEK